MVIRDLAGAGDGSAPARDWRPTPALLSATLLPEAPPLTFNSSTAPHVLLVLRLSRTPPHPPRLACGERKDTYQIVR